MYKSKNTLKPARSITSSMSSAPKKSKSKKKVQFEKKKEEEIENQPNGTTDLTSPEFCTLLKITEEMKKLRTHESTRSLPEVPRYRNLNFQPKEKIYQDLVPLEVPDGPSVLEAKSQLFKCPLKKDPEPDASKYLKYDLPTDYYFHEFVKVSIKKQTPVFDGRLVYDKVKEWDEEYECL